MTDMHRHLGLAGVLLCSVAISCQRSTHSNAATSSVTANQHNAVKAGTGATIVDVLAQWRGGDKKLALATARQIAKAQHAGVRLRHFSMKETEFRQLSQQQRDELSPKLLADANTLRAVGGALVDRAREAGNIDDARLWLAAARAVGEANSDSDLILVGRLAGEAVRVKAAREQAELSPEGM